MAFQPVRSKGSDSSLRFRKERNMAYIEAILLLLNPKTIAKIRKLRHTFDLRQFIHETILASRISLIKRYITK